MDSALVLIMAIFKYYEWIHLWLTQTSKFLFEWDSGNCTKSEKKHGISTNKIEEAFTEKKFLPLGIQTSPVHREDRFAIIGQDKGRQLIFVAFTIRKGKIRPISARFANKKEKHVYEKAFRKISS